jgi:hypothetical protein
MYNAAPEWQDTNGALLADMSTSSLSRFAVVVSLFALVGCGGGSGNVTPPPPPPPPPSFTLSLSTNSFTLSQNSSQNIQVTAVPQNGFSATVSVTASGLPAGVTVSPSSLSVTPNNQGNLTFSATANVMSGSAQVSVAGISGSVRANANLSLNVIQVTTPVAMPFTTTGGGIEKAFYDESRQLLFATNLFLNEIDVLSGKDLSVQSRIPVSQPFGIDQMLDGNTLVVGTATQGFYTINENTLSATYHKAPNFTQLRSTMILLTPVAMANGKILFLGQDIGVATAGSYVFAGQSIIEWDSGTGQFTQPFYVPWLSLTIDHLKRSADHNWAVFAADKLYVYSAQTDSLTSSAMPVNSAPYGVRDIAASPQGSQFAVASARSVSFYDPAFNLLGTLDFGNLGGLLFSGANTSQYSTDGRILYWELDGDQGGGSVLGAINTSTFADMGNTATNYGTQTQFEPNLLLVDSQHRAFFSALGGVGTLDATRLRVGPPSMIGGLGPNPFSVPLNQAVAVTLNPTNYTLPLGTSVTIGGNLVPLQSTNPMVVQAPPSSVPGPVDVVVTQPDGSSLLEPQNFVYGLDVAAPTATLVPPIGNPVIGLFGFGMLNGPSMPPTVAVGGQTIQNLAVNPGAKYLLQELFLQLPDAPPGATDITVTGNNGVGTLKAGITYIPFANVIPSSRLLQLLYDSHRDLLYALQSTQIQVLNPTSLQWQTPMRPGSNGGIGYSSMAITPDGSKMMVLDSTANTLTVFDPGNPSQGISTPVAPSTGATLYSVAATSTGKAFIGSFNGAALEFDLATNTYKTVNNSWLSLAKFVGTPDGNYVLGVDESSNSGLVGLWNSTTSSFSTQSLWGVFWVDAAISSDGTRLAAVKGDLGAAGIAAGLFDQKLHFTNATIYPDLGPPDQPFCTGAIFSATGQTLLSPLGDSIDFFDTRTGTLRGRLLTPEPLPTGGQPVAITSAGVIALDPNQQTIYAISQSGLTVLVLPTAVDQVTPFPWPYVAKPSGSVPSARLQNETIHLMSW